MGIQIDLAGIDLPALIEQETQMVRFGKWSGYGEKRTCKAQCPWCHGTDRFAVLDSNPQHFYCGIHGGAGCGKHGDAVSFMQQWHNIPFMQACKRLEVTPLLDGEEMKPDRASKIYTNIDRIPCEEWRLAAEYFLRRCQAYLWDEAGGKDARTYLYERGFTDEEMRIQGYGYNPKTIFDRDTARWGITDETVQAVRLPRGMVIPFFVGSDLWKVNIRRPLVDIQEEEKRTGDPAKKYVNIKGGSNPIYHADVIKPGKPLIAFEGEYNADILAMVLRLAGITDIGVIATGSTGKGRADNWLAKIAKASPILFSFDPDGSGAKAVKDYWKKVLPNALVWPSRDGDLNDMYLAGGSAAILKWLNKGLKIAGSEMQLVVPAQQKSAQPLPSEHVEEVPSAQPPYPLQGKETRHFKPWPELSMQQIIRIAENLQRSGITFRVVDGRLHYECDFVPTPNVRRFMMNCQSVLIKWLRGPYGEAETFYQTFCARSGYHLRLLEGDQIAIGVPETLSDEKFQAIKRRVDSFGDVLVQVMKDASVLPVITLQPHMAPIGGRS